MKCTISLSYLVTIDLMFYILIFQCSGFGLRSGRQRLRRRPVGRHRAREQRPRAEDSARQGRRSSRL